MPTIRSNRDEMRDGALEDERSAAYADPERTEPVWPGFRAARLITLVKMRGDARAAAVLAVVIVAATAAVLGAPHVEEMTRELGAVLGIGLRASEYPR